MKPHEAPYGFLATLGHPANKIIIVKGASGWRYIDNGQLVEEEAFRSGWDDWVPEYMKPVKAEALDENIEMQLVDILGDIKAQKEKIREVAKARGVEPIEVQDQRGVWLWVELIEAQARALSALQDIRKRR